MSATTTVAPSSLQGLLAESSWAIRLARALIHDQAAAEDLVQDAWLAALRARPSGDRPLRPWLRRVLRNRAQNQAREQKRREARDALVGATLVSDGGSHSPEELVDRLQMQRLLADLVMALPEPLRQTLLMRYYEGSSGADIARRLSVPEGTVRWRLKEALDQLRLQLAAWEEKNHRGWRLALAPLAAYPKASPMAGAAATTTAVTSKPLLSAPVLATAAVAVVGLIAGVHVVQSRRFSPAGTHAVNQRQDGAGPAGFRGGSGVISDHRPASRPTPRTAARSVPRFTTAALSQPSKRPAVRSELVPQQPVVTGGLDEESVERVIRTHVTEVRYCHQQELATDPRLEGQASVRFTIGPMGMVTTSSLESSTSRNPHLERCLLIAVRRWEFPEPQGGAAHVTYPFVLTAAAGER